MAITAEERATLARHESKQAERRLYDDVLNTYYDHEQFVVDIGLELPTFEGVQTMVGWPAIAVDAWTSRTDMRAMYLPGSESADPQLRDVWEANNMDSEFDMFMVDRYVNGRGFLSVGVNPEDRSTPLVHVESPLTMSIDVDGVTRRSRSACKLYGTTDAGWGPTHATLYLPDETVWLSRQDGGGWREVWRDQHRLGRVPVVASFYGRRSGQWDFRSAMSPTLRDLADDAIRALTNMKYASAAHGVPHRWAVGMSKGDFVDANGKPKPAWQARIDAIWATGNAEAKFGNFASSDLKNFETQMNVLVAQAAAAAHLPQRFFGEKTSQPPNADAIRADEVELVNFVKRQNRQVGAALGWAAGLALRIANGEWVDGSRIGVEFHDPATPTIAQREDALMKRRSQHVLSVEGYWDELGWSEARKAKERQYMAQEADDPILARFDAMLSNGDQTA